MFTPRAPLASAPLITLSMWSRSWATWSKSDQSSSLAGAASRSRRCTSVPEPAGAAASRFSRSSAFRSPSLSTQTSPERTSGASARRRPWTVFADTSRSAGSAGPWTLSGVMNLRGARNTSSIIDSMTGWVW